MKTGLAPIADENSEILILGSLPGDESIRRQQYYAHPRNHFWPLMAALLEESLADEYSDRCKMLLMHKIALWDVLLAAYRYGSLDTNIRAGQPNDIAGFLDAHPKIRFILLNGTAANRCFEKHFSDTNLPHLMVRSTSPIPSKTGNTFEEKLAIWKTAFEAGDI